MKKFATVTALILVVVLVVGAVYAQFAKPEEAIKYRKAVMFLIAQHFKRMGAVVQGKTPYEKEAFSSNAAAVQMLATLPWEACMVPGTDKGDTTLSPAVFQQPAEFKKAAESFEADTAMLAGAAKDGDLDTIKAQFGQVAKNCKSCHTSFRQK